MSTILGLLDILRGGGPLDALGRTGTTWFEHAGDRALEERPSEDAVDLPIPRRPLRGRSI